jgi:hypothetical protein
VQSQDIETLRRDKRMFAPVVLAGRMMIAARGKPAPREKYALELLKIMRERGYDNAKKINILRFIGHILRLRDNDINSELRGEFLMQFITQSEYRKRMLIEDAKEEWSIEVARSMLADGVSVEKIKKYTGLDEYDIRML